MDAKHTDAEEESRGFIDSGVLVSTWADVGEVGQRESSFPGQARVKHALRGFRCA